MKANGFFKKQSHEISDFICFFVYTFLDELQQPLLIFVFNLQFMFRSISNTNGISYMPSLAI